MSDTFRDAVSQVIHDNVAADVGDPWDWSGAPTDAVFAMPEMKAVREALDGMARSLAYECNDDVNHADADGRFTHPDRHSSLRECWLAEFMPDGMESVIAWVVGDDRP